MLIAWNEAQLEFLFTLYSRVFYHTCSKRYLFAIIWHLKSTKHGFVSSTNKALIGGDIFTVHSEMEKSLQVLNCEMIFWLVRNLFRSSHVAPRYDRESMEKTSLWKVRLYVVYAFVWCFLPQSIAKLCSFCRKKKLCLNWVLRDFPWISLLCILEC